MHPKILIVMTTPYSTSDSSRTLDAYFHYWEKDRVAQIFSRNWIPNKGHCGEMYQITDASLLKKWIHKPVEVGKIYTYEEMREQNGNEKIQDNSTAGLYKIGGIHSPMIELFRGALWKKKYWCTEKLVKWLDNYKPECIVYNFSNHLFTQQIALYAAKRFNIPIIAVIGDDYYFNDKFSISPAYWLFRYKFKKLTERVLSNGASAVYCSDKIRDKYNEYFGISGETIYVTSSITRREFREINKDAPKFVYFGSIRLGRNNALCDIATALGEINASYKLEVYSNESDERIYRCLMTHTNIFYGGTLPYHEVERRMLEADVFVIAEGFRNEDINFTRYSLSTKAADGLACGTSILTYGPSESGVVEYMQETEASMVCSNKKELKNAILELINNVGLQKKYYDKAILASEKNHTLKSTTTIFESVVAKTIRKEYEK